MPVLRFPVDMLLNRTGLQDLGLLRDTLFRLKCETDILDDGSLEVEINPDRPDMYSIEGIARAVRGILGMEKGWRAPQLEKSGLVLVADRVVTRPFIVAAVATSVNIEDEEDLRQIIQFQEKLHDTIGRRRRKVAIGFHDLSKLPSPRLRYTMIPLDKAWFEPLGHEGEMSGAEVLERTAQGRSYGYIAVYERSHPFLLSGDKIIAMPPVINSNITRIDVGTRDMFIDVTGTDLKTVLKVLDIIACNLHYRGASIQTVDIIAPYMERETPLLESQTLRLSADWVNKQLGYSVTVSQAADLLERMRFRVEKAASDTLIVGVPPFRADIISEIDLIEDIAIAIGYEKMYPVYARPATRGYLLRETLLNRSIRTIMLGLGFQEVMQLTLTSPRLLEALGLRGVELENPVQQEYSVLRPSLVPGLLGIAKENQHAEKPVKVFEIGKIIKVDDNNIIIEKSRLGMMIMDSEISVEMIQAPLYALLRALGLEFSVENTAEYSFLIDGRSGIVTLEGSRLGYFGEVKPSVLEKLGIEYPVAVAELDLEVLKEWRFKMSGQK